jgi:hypothetical protein
MKKSIISEKAVTIIVAVLIITGVIVTMFLTKNLHINY